MTCDNNEAIKRDYMKLCTEITDACRIPDNPPAILRDLLVPLPVRWGRMNLLSRLAIAGAGYLLRDRDMCLDGLVAGFVAGTRCGCLDTDLLFISTIHDNMPSPVIFSYTLPNTALSEAAAYFGMRGPVYSVLDADDPCKASRREARRLLDFLPGVDLMIYGELDVCPDRRPGIRLNIMAGEKCRAEKSCS